MGELSGKIALVTGASRGVGKGIALALGEAGATVYITGRTVDESQASVPLAGTISNTAAAVTEAGGNGIAVQCDHRDDTQVEAVFKRIQDERGQLDLLVNNAWAGYEGYFTNQYMPPHYPFWEKSISYWDDNLIGVRWTYVASVLASRMMIQKRTGLIVNISFSPLTPGNPAYNVAKTGVDQLSVDMALNLHEYDVAVVSLHPGLVRTEGVLSQAQYFDLSNSESPQFTGRAVCALASDASIMAKSGNAFVVANLAQTYDFNDIDGTRPRPIADAGH